MGSLRICPSAPGAMTAACAFRRVIAALRRVTLLMIAAPAGVVRTRRIPLAVRRWVCALVGPTATVAAATTATATLLQCRSVRRCFPFHVGLDAHTNLRAILQTIRAIH